MENTIELGLNRTGLDMAPLAKNELISFATAKCHEAPIDDGTYSTTQAEYVREADRVGAVPVPATVTGIASTALEKISGNKPEVFVDKLGERLAFERTGTRLYEALMRKCAALAETTGSESRTDEEGIAVSDAEGAVVGLSILKQIRDDEEVHFHLVQRAIETLGADPTAMTPCADVAGVMAQGLMQTITDPRTTIPQCLNALLTAELTDNAGWELLIEMAEDLGHSELAQEFSKALTAERVHLETVKAWLRRATLSEAT